MTKVIVNIILIMLSTPAWSCDQKLYDYIYVGILKESLRTNDIRARNLQIRNLRKLCNGQLSTYETDWSKKNVQNKAADRKRHSNQ